jgi:hypothetical protein
MEETEENKEERESKENKAEDIVAAPCRLLRCSEAVFHVMLRQEQPTAPLELKVTAKLSRPVFHLDMSQIYSALVATLPLRRLSAAWKRPSSHHLSQPRSQSISVQIDLPALTLHVGLPLAAPVVLDIGAISFSKPPEEGVVSTVARVQLYIPQKDEDGAGVWRELGRIREMRVASAKPVPGEVPAFTISAECFRVSIPNGYLLNDLILNLNVSFKSLKTLVGNLRGVSFSTRFEPQAEQPKRLPRIHLSVRYFSFEALDNPFESRLNLVLRSGLVEKAWRNETEDAFQAKVEMMQSAEVAESLEAGGGKGARLTRNATVSVEEARRALDLKQAESHKARYASGRAKIYKEEKDKRRPYHIPNPDGYLKLRIPERDPAPPLFRVAFERLEVDVSALTWSQEQIVDYMSACSATPFDKGVEFSLMVPLQLKWTMHSADYRLRDYPLPLIGLRSSDPDVPVWSLETPFVIAEDLHGPDTWFGVPTEILPAGLGASGAAPLSIAVQKTITPVKTYTQPIVAIRSEITSEFAWANSYQPTIQDMTRIFDGITSPMKDPSEKPGFWDKFRLILHWKVQLDFKGPVHLHAKGEVFCLAMLLQS